MSRFSCNGERNNSFNCINFFLSFISGSAKPADDSSVDTDFQSDQGPQCKHTHYTIILYLHDQITWVTVAQKRLEGSLESFTIIAV